MDKDFYIALIIKHLKGEISYEERDELRQWLASSEENVTFRREIANSWRASKKGVKELEVNTAKDFLRLKKRIEHDKRKPNKITRITTKAKPERNYRRVLYGVAAAAAILVGVFWFFSQPEELSRELVMRTEMGEVRSTALQDGTKIWLHGNSKIVWPREFEKEERRVQLTGEGFFEVTKNSNQPFIIELENAQVKVLGTSFSIADRKNVISVQVEEGVVVLSDSSNIKSVQLSAGEFGEYTVAINNLEKKDNYRKNRNSWKTKNLTFDSMPLSEVVKDLESFFGSKVTIESDRMKACLYGGYFPKPDINKVLSSIAAAYEMKVTQDINGNYNLREGVCKK